MRYFSYNDYMDCTKNGEIEEIKKVEEETAKYEVISGEEQSYSTKNKIIQMLKDKTNFKMFIQDFFNLSEMLETEKIIYCKEPENRTNNIIYKIEQKEIYILIKVIDKIDNNITYKIFEDSLNTMKKTNEEQTKNKRHPIIIPIVIYVGKEKWNIDSYNISNEVNYTEFEKNRINFSYNFINIHSLEIGKLLKMNSNITKEFINAKINIYK